MNILFYNIDQVWDNIFFEDDIMITAFKNCGHNVHIVGGHKYRKRYIKHYYEKVLTIIDIIKFIKNHKIDIVVTDTISDVSVAGVASRFCKVPNIRKVSKEIDLFMEKKRYKILMNHFVSYYIFDRYFEIDKKINQTLKPMDTSYIRSTWGVSDETVVIGATTELDKNSSIDDLIKVFAKLIKTYKNIYLIIAGNGERKDIFRQLTIDYKIEKSVAFIGETANPKMLASVYDICFLDSNNIGDPNSIHEFVKGMTGSLYEYLMVKKPLIISNSGKERNVLRHQYNSLIYQTGDLESLYQHIETILTNPNFTDEISTNAYNTAKLYTINKDISEIEEINLYHIFGDTLYEL